MMCMQRGQAQSRLHDRLHLIVTRSATLQRASYLAKPESLGGSCAYNSSAQRKLLSSPEFACAFSARCSKGRPDFFGIAFACCYTNSSTKSLTSRSHGQLP